MILVLISPGNSPQALPVCFATSGRGSRSDRVARPVLRRCHRGSCRPRSGPVGLPRLGPARTDSPRAEADWRPCPSRYRLRRAGPGRVVAGLAHLILASFTAFPAAGRTGTFSRRPILRPRRAACRAAFSIACWPPVAGQARRPRRCPFRPAFWATASCHRPGPRAAGRILCLSPPDADSAHSGPGTSQGLVELLADSTLRLLSSWSCRAPVVPPGPGCLTAHRASDSTSACRRASSFAFWPDSPPDLSWPIW